MLAEMLGVEDGRVGKGPVEPALGDVAVGGLREVDAVPAPVVGGVRARVRPRLPALGRQVEVVHPHARRTAAGPRRLLQHPCARRGRKRDPSEHVAEGNVHQNRSELAGLAWAQALGPDRF